MPRNSLSSRLPKYRKHRASGQAIVTLSGLDHYLGPHGTNTSKLEYDRLIAEWLQNGRHLRAREDQSLTVIEVIAAYFRYARSYYRKEGVLTSEYVGVKYSVRELKELYGHRPVEEFGPLSLQTVRQRMIDNGYSRGVVNQSVGRIKRMFKWAAAEELISARVPQSLATVAGLRRGRTDARESKPVLPVDDTLVAATLPHLPEVVADMVRLQRLTGMRPAELCMIRPCDIDRAGEVWRYVPASHKTEHHGRERIVCIGPLAQAILLRYLARESEAYCFRPCDSEAKRRMALHAARRTPMLCGNKPGSNRRRKPQHVPGLRYDVGAYRRAIQRACDKAFPAPGDIANEPARLSTWQSQHRWAPNQLRHSAATEIRRMYGLEAAQTVLGHSQANVTQIYAERDYSLAARVAKEVG
jgi:integrase